MVEKQAIMQSAMEGTNKATARLIQSTRGATVETEALEEAQKASAVSAKMQSAALKAVSVAANVGLVIVLNLVISKIHEAIQAEEKAREKAVELTNAYKEQQSSLDNQIKKYQELKQSLDEGNLSTDDARSIKEQLLEIQTSLIESYGNEASGLDLVNGKYEEQLGLLRGISKEKAQDYVTEHRDDFETAQRELNKQRTYDLGNATTWYMDNITEEQQKLIDYISTYSDVIKLTRTGYNEVSSINVSVKANAKDADELIHQFTEDVEKYANEIGIDISPFLSSISRNIGNVWTDELQEYQDIYDEFMKAEVIRNDTLRPLYQQSIDAVEAYNKALASGEGLEEAKANLDAVKISVQNATGELEGSQAVFDDIFNQINEVAAAINDVANPPSNDTTLLSISQTVDQLNTQLKPAFDSLKSAYQDIFTDDGFALNSIDILSTCDAIKSKLDDMSEIGLDINYDAYERFVSVLSNSESTADDVQSAFNDLATAITDVGISGIEEFNTMKSALEDLGIVNNEIVAFDALISNTDALKEAGLDLADATDEEIQAFVNEIVTAENCGQALFMLTYQKELLNLQEIDTASEVANLRTLAENAGYTGEVIANLTELEQIYQAIASGVYGTNTQQVAMAKQRAAELQKAISEYSGKVEYNPKVVAANSSNKSAGSAGKEAGEAYTEALEKELNALDKKMEAGYIDFNSYINARLNLIEDYYRKGKISADEYYSYLEKHYETQLSYMDKAIDAVTRRLNKEIDSLEKQKDDIEDYYNLQIESLEKQKTLLQEANEERERQLNLQKSLYELERARNQRTTLLYSEDKGMHYVADDSAIRDATQEAEDAEFDIKISEIEKSITKLEEARDRETDAIDAMIDKLQEYCDQWENITSAYEEQQDNLIAAQMLGQEWEQDILNGRLDTLNNFKNNYIAIQQAMVDAAYQAAQAMAQAQNVKIGDSSAGIQSGGSDRPSSSGSGKNINAPATSSNSSHGWVVVDDVTSNKVSKYFSNETDARLLADNLNGSRAAGMGMTLYDFKNKHMAGYSVKKYHTGLAQGLVDNHSFDDDFKLVQRVGLGDKDVLAVLKEGEAVVTQKQISNIANGLKPDSKDRFEPLPDYHPIMYAIQGFKELMDGDVSVINNPALIEMGKEMAKTIGSINNVNNNSNAQAVTIGDIYVTCPGVTSQEVMREVGDALNRQFSGLALAALQQSKK